MGRKRDDLVVLYKTLWLCESDPQMSTTRGAIFINYHLALHQHCLLAPVLSLCPECRFLNSDHWYQWNRVCPPPPNPCVQATAPRDCSGSRVFRGN